MNEKSWKILRILFVLGMCFGIIRWQFATGFALGTATALFLYKRIERWCDSMIAMNTAATDRQASAHFIGNYGIMAAVLILSALMPDVFNIFATAIGLMMIKITVLVESLMNRKEGIHEI